MEHTRRPRHVAALNIEKKDPGLQTLLCVRNRINLSETKLGCTCHAALDPFANDIYSLPKPVVDSSSYSIRTETRRGK